MKNQDQRDSQAKHPIQNPAGKQQSQRDQHNQQGQQDQQDQQRQQGDHKVEQFKGKWQQQVGAAKIQWGKLTNDELMQSKGEAQKLSGLVQERYAVTGAIADKQVSEFFATCRN